MHQRTKAKKKIWNTICLNIFLFYKYSMAKTVFDLNNSKLKVIEFLFIFSFKK